MLDLGCGAGSLVTARLAERFAVTGVDISPRLIELAQRNVPNARFLEADMTALRLPPESFDGIAAFYALTHVPREELPALLRNIAGWLRPGGRFVASLGASPNRGALEPDWLGVPMYFSGDDAETGRRLVESAGLQIVSACEETADEDGRPATFLWIVARKPGTKG